KYSGASGSPITLKNYSGEAPRINGPIGLVSSSGILNPISWIIVEGFDINNFAGSPLTSNGIVLTNAANIVIRGNTVHDSKNQGIGGNGYNITIDRNVVSRTGLQETDPSSFNKHHGIYLTGTSISITNNIIHSNLAYGIQIAAYPYDSTKHAGVEYAWAKNWVISNNVIAFQKNRSGIVVWQSGADNNTIQNNIFYDNSQTPGADDTHGILFYNGAGNIVRNNLFYSSNPGKITINNLAGSGAFTQSNTLVQQDPSFANAPAFDFHLQTASPAINAGISDKAPAIDFNGTTRPQGSAYDIGAYEFTGSANISSCSLYTPSSPIPDRFASPFWVANNPSQSLINVNCSSAIPSLSVGVSTDTYVYKDIYIYKNNQWEKLANLQGTPVYSNEWYQGTV
ncbi:MAG: right-handed parallel beta-helix repeat-containing protein, partial [Patescibacteria group bacterium]